LSASVDESEDGARIQQDAERQLLMAQQTDGRIGKLSARRFASHRSATAVDSCAAMPSDHLLADSARARRARSSGSARRLEVKSLAVRPRGDR